MTSEGNSFIHSGERNMTGREEIILGLNWRVEEDKKNIKCESIEKKKFRGFHLSRSKWDPYPWVGSVETGSDAELSGLRYAYHIILLNF